MAKLNHTHTYQLYKSRSGKPREGSGKIPFYERTFRCVHPHCTHFSDAEALIGKASLCNLCGEEFILTTEDLKRVKPRCLKCSETKQGKAAKAAASLIGDLLKNLDETAPEVEQND